MLVSSDMIRQISTHFVMMPKINAILQQCSNIIKSVRVRFMVSNVIFNNISVIYRGVSLLVEETEVPGKKPPTCRTSLTYFIT